MSSSRPTVPALARVARRHMGVALATRASATSTGWCPAYRARARAHGDRLRRRHRRRTPRPHPPRHRGVSRQAGLPRARQLRRRDARPDSGRGPAPPSSRRGRGGGASSSASSRIRRCRFVPSIRRAGTPWSPTAGVEKIHGRAPGSSHAGSTTSGRPAPVAGAERGGEAVAAYVERISAGAGFDTVFTGTASACCSGRDAGQRQRLGAVDRPAEHLRLALPLERGVRASTSSSAIRSSARAIAAPAHLCGPWPKARCGFGERSRTNVLRIVEHLGIAVGRRQDEGGHLALADLRPRTSTSWVAVRRIPGWARRAAVAPRAQAGSGRVGPQPRLSSGCCARWSTALASSAAARHAPRSAAGGGCRRRLVLERLALDAHREEGADEVLAGVERRRFLAATMAALGVQVLVLALGRLDVEVGLGALERSPLAFSSRA